jgi:hypothetical protein
MRSGRASSLSVLRTTFIALCSFGCFVGSTLRSATSFASELIDNQSSIQQAIDHNPGGTITIPQGDHAIDAPLVIRHDGTVLCGFGRIIQTNPNAPIIQIAHAADVVVRDLTLTRPEATADTNFQGINVVGCERLRLERLRIIDNRTKSSSIRLEQCAYCRIEECYILNYKRITIEDRSRDPRNGFAFRCIDGTGIHVTRSTGTMILNNQVIERNLLPTREVKEQFHLGELVEGAVPTKFGIFGRSFEKNHGTKTWHQGAAIAVTQAEVSSFTRVSGNYIENAAQGVDNQCDDYLITENIINRGMMGMKAMHGSSIGMVAGNIFSHVDNWGIMLGAGASSHAAEPAHNGHAARPANTDGIVVVSNNLVTDFGRGLEFWNWGVPHVNPAAPGAFLIKRGQIPTNPSLRHVLIESNMVTSPDDEIAENGTIEPVKARYRQAVQMDRPANANDGYQYPQDIRFYDNILAPGRDGLSSVALPPSNFEAYGPH